MSVPLMTCNRIHSEVELLGGEGKQEKNKNGKGGILDVERGKNFWLTHGIGGLKVLVIYSQEVCTLRLGIPEKQDRMNHPHLAEQMLKTSSGIRTTLSSL